jgi:hypothetical protein
MKLLKYITIIFLFVNSVYSLEKLPIVKSNTSLITIKDGENLAINSWALAPDARPDVYRASLINGKAHNVIFYTDIDSIQFYVELGKKYDFIIIHGKDSCYTRIEGTRFVPSAVFDKNYQTRHKGKINVEIPEIYELVNIAIAVTPYAINDKYMVFKKSSYYESVREWFDKYQNHTLIVKLDSLLSENSNRYFSLKMNGYAFEYDDKNQIVNSTVYDRTSFPNERVNSIRPYLQSFQSFSDETGFREFYKENKLFYQQQIKFYKDTANVIEMKSWLDDNFPSSNDYDSYKIIFSPLVAYSQSFTWFNSNGFKELLAHVNYPYLSDFKKIQANVSNQTLNIYRGNIAFTEINHGYINPEADKYSEQISKAISNRNTWIESTRALNYYSGNAIFTEYMNWALVSLRILDYVPKDQQDYLIKRVESMMIKNRGFIRFSEFNSFLMNLYKKRGSRQTLADLYPLIIEWFEKNNKN